MAELYQNTVDWLFGKELTVDERIKKMQETIKGSSNTIRKEIRNLERDRDRLGSEIKRKAATQPDKKELTQLAQQHVRYKNQICGLRKTIDKLNGFNTMMSDVRVNAEMSKAFIDVSRCMSMINNTSSAFNVLSVIEQYDYEKMKMDFVQEEIDEKINDAYEEGSEDEEAAEDILKQVFDELHIETDGNVCLFIVYSFINCTNDYRCLLYQ